MVDHKDRHGFSRPIWTMSLVLTAAALGGGFLLGKSIVDKTPTAEPTATATPAAGTRFASATDPDTHARLTIALIPATGWVKVNAAISGLPLGEGYQLFITSRTGERVLSASWSVSKQNEDNGTKLDGSALIEPSDATAAEVTDIQGKKYVSVEL